MRQVARSSKRPDASRKKSVRPRHCCVHCKLSAMRATLWRCRAAWRPRQRAT